MPLLRGCPLFGITENAFIKRVPFIWSCLYGSLVHTTVPVADWSIAVEVLEA